VIRTAILTINVISPFGLIALWPVEPAAGIALLLAAHAAVLYPTLSPNSQWWGPVVTRLATTEPHVWLTIDDGPDPDDTPSILDLLDSHEARATFFVKGSLASKHPELIREIVNRGHEIGNHSHTHPSASFWCLWPSRLAREIDTATEAISEAGGGRPARFRAPVGMKNFWVHPLLAKRGMRLIGWSDRGWDTVSRDPGRVTERLVRNLRPGAILLAHEGAAVTGHRGVDVLRELLPRISALGYRCVVPKEEQLLGRAAL
jgi:peptidoglycan-N-acetylglucosamine deacetylase